MAVELREVKEDGNYGEILPDWSDLTFSQDLLAAGSLTFKYPITGRNVEVLKHGVSLACLLDGREPVNGRFMYNEAEGARLSDADSSVTSYGCVSNIDRASKMKLAPAFGSVYADENLFDFKNVTSGWLVRNAVDNSMSRGYQLSSKPQAWLDHPLQSFSDTEDSAGVPWPTTYDAKFTPGTSSVQSVIDWNVQNGFAEAQMYMNELRLYQPENNGRDLTVGKNPVVLQTGRDFIEATYQTTSKDLVNALLVLGDDSTCVWVYDNESIYQYGYREDTLSVSNASSVSTLQAAGEAYLSTRKIPRYSYTYSVSALYLESTNSNPRPFIDYQVGDSVLILDGFATSVQRIRLLSATWPSSRAATVNLTVNDFFAERDVQLDRRISRLGLGA